MPGPFHGIDLASRALRSFQRALDVTGHNIANVNTRGYSRQTIDFVQTDPVLYFSNGAQQLGTGVSVASINRIRDLFLEGRMHDAQAELSRHGQMATSLKDVMEVYGEPGSTGISSAMDKFFDAWSGLASNPNEPAMRLQVRIAGQDLANKIRGSFTQMSALQGDMKSQVEQTLTRVSELGQTIDSLNKQIRTQAALGGTPNDLLDQRDVAIEELSTLVNVKTSLNADSTMNVFVSQFTLVDSAGGYRYPTTYDAATHTLTDGMNTYSVKSGHLAGLMQAQNEVTKSMVELDQLANNLRTQFNTLHMTGTNANGTTNIRFFGDVAVPPQTGAIDFDLSAEVLADPKNIAASVSGNAGDGALALALSNLRNQTVVGLGSKTFSAFHRDHIARLGSDQSYFGKAAETQMAIVEQVESQRQSVSGVSLDDEMANMLRYQRSYQAAAKMLSLFDQVTEDLIGMLRR